MSQIVKHSRVPLLLALVWLTGCSESPSTGPVSNDLAAGLSVADWWSETRVVDPGTLRGRRFLTSGWSGDRWDRGRNRPFVQSRGEASVVRFDVIEARPLVLRVFASSAESESSKPSQVDLLVNGNRVESFEIESRPRRRRVSVPEGLLHPGENDLTLEYPGTEDNRPRVNLYQIAFQFNDGGEPPQPHATREEGVVMIPFGTRLEYTLMLPADALLTIGRLQYVGPAGGELTLILEEDEHPLERIPLPDEATEAFSLSLPSESPRIVRLSLRADHPGVDASGRSGVLLTAPVIRSPAAVPEELAASPEASNGPLPRLPEMPNILLYVVDTLRADHLGLYGYDKPVSPALDSFGARATVFENAVAQSSWTRAAMASIFTGLWPLKHATNGRKDILDPEAMTLAEILSEAGYVTVAKVRNWNVFPVFGFRQGFEEFHKVREGKADRVNRLVEGWLDSRPQDRPFFLWVHTVDPHEPYRPPAATRELFMEEGQQQFDLDKHPGFKQTREMSNQERQSVVKYLLSLYDAEIAFNDRAFGELIALLEKLDLLDSTVVIFVSDHGEEFLEHGTWGHGRNLHAENLNVPMVVRLPDRGHGIRVEEVVQQIDLLPTLLDYIGLPIPAGVEGRSFLPLLSPGPSATGQSSLAFSFLHLDGAQYRSLVDGEWKLVQRLSEDGEASQSGLFDRRSDPGEARNQILDHPIRSRYMELILDAKMGEGSLLTTEEAILDEETESALKALGYLQ